METNPGDKQAGSSSKNDESSLENEEAAGSLAANKASGAPSGSDKKSANVEDSQGAKGQVAVSTSTSHWLDLLLLSVVGLFFELVAIRWLSAEMRAFTIFKNFPLIACYVGLGFGFMRARGDGKLFKLFPLLLLILIAATASSDLTGLAHLLSPSMSVGGGVQTAWFDAATPPELLKQNQQAYLIISVAVFFALLILVASTMAAIGQRLGYLFNQGEALRSYLVNLLGSAIGIAMFSFLSLFCSPPLVWISVGCGAAIWPYRKEKIGLALLACVIAVTLALPPRCNLPASDVADKISQADQKGQVLWSPYHRIDMAPNYLQFGDAVKQIGYKFGVNKGYFQQALNLSDQFIDSIPDAGQKEKIKLFRLDQYELAYQFLKPKSMLILGSGTGNDVAAALRHGVEHIDAVEIDPLIAKMGQELHPDHPYASPNVRLTVNDARAFLRQHNDKYDLITTGFLDSHTVVGNSLSVRLDDYVYTVDGMKDAIEHLNPGGVYFITYCAPQEFLSDRLVANIREASKSLGDAKPVIITRNDGRIWHLLTPASPQIHSQLENLKKDGFVDASDKDTKNIRPSTDDWPFLYLNPISNVDPLYLSVVAGILLLSWAACGPSVRRNNSPARWRLFFLGAAFLLLELSIIDRLALVFGTTWLVNSVCIFAVLTALIFANIIVIRRSLMPLKSMYACLLASLIVIYLVPLQAMTALGMWVGGSLAAVLSVVPVFFAGLIFSTCFSKEKEPSVGLAFNLLGAVVGGLLEYTAIYMGIRSLLLLAFILYAVSMAIPGADAAKGE